MSKVVYYAQELEFKKVCQGQIMETEINQIIALSVEL
jgi:hypothetical protein